MVNDPGYKPTDLDQAVNKCIRAGVGYCVEENAATGEKLLFFGGVKVPTRFSNTGKVLRERGVPLRPV